MQFLDFPLGSVKLELILVNKINRAPATGPLQIQLDGMLYFSGHENIDTYHVGQARTLNPSTQEGDSLLD